MYTSVPTHRDYWKRGNCYPGIRLIPTTSINIIAGILACVFIPGYPGIQVPGVGKIPTKLQEHTRVPGYPGIPGYRARSCSRTDTRGATVPGYPAYPGTRECQLGIPTASGARTTGTDTSSGTHTVTVSHNEFEFTIVNTNSTHARILVPGYPG
eukprot:472285-Rhodomonas_salina.3